MTTSSEGLDVVIPEDIRADKANIAYLAIKQMDRINRLTSLGIAQGKAGLSEDSVVKGIVFGCTFLEKMLTLSDKYYAKKEKEISKVKINQYKVRNHHEVLPEVAKWYGLIVEYSGLRPPKPRTYKFDDAAPDWGDEDNKKGTKTHTE